MLELDVFAFDVAKTAERVGQNRQVFSLFVGAASMPKHTNSRNSCTGSILRKDEMSYPRDVRFPRDLSGAWPLNAARYSRARIVSPDRRGRVTNSPRISARGNPIVRGHKS